MVDEDRNDQDSNMDEGSSQSGAGSPDISRGEDGDFQLSPEIPKHGAEEDFESEESEPVRRPGQSLKNKAKGTPRVKKVKRAAEMNPELYGLRRSVCSAATAKIACLTRRGTGTGRSTQGTRPVVNTRRIDSHPLGI